MPENKFTQTQQQQQTLAQTLSPQQLLAVQLLELTTIEIEERVRGEVMDNPALDAVEPDEVSLQDAVDESDADVSALDIEDDYSGNGDIPVVSGGSRSCYDSFVSDTLSFGDTLVEQLHELTLSPVEVAVGEYLIGSLDEDGLLRKPLHEIEDELSYTIIWRFLRSNCWLFSRRYRRSSRQVSLRVTLQSVCCCSSNAMPKAGT